jgi:hypothetical protein
VETASLSVTEPESRFGLANYQALAFGLCLDKSSSMSPYVKGVIGGYNGLVDDQRRLPGQVSTTLVQFGDTEQLIYDNIPVSKLPVLNRENYVPGGSTALLDGLGLTMELIGNRFDASVIGSLQVLIAILSDGWENASTKHTLEQVAEDIRFRQSEDSWQFIFLAAGTVAADYARSLGIPETHIINFLAEDVAVLLLKFSRAIGQYRLGNPDYLALMQ